MTERKKTDFGTSNTVQDLSRLVKGWRKNQAALSGRAEVQNELSLSAINSIILYLEVAILLYSRE